MDGHGQAAFFTYSSPGEWWKKRLALALGRPADMS